MESQKLRDFLLWCGGKWEYRSHRTFQTISTEMKEPCQIIQNTKISFSVQVILSQSSSLKEKTVVMKQWRLFEYDHQEKIFSREAVADALN